MKTCNTCGTRYWRLHTWQECLNRLQSSEELARAADAADQAAKRFAEAAQDLRSRT